MRNQVCNMLLRNLISHHYIFLPDFHLTKPIVTIMKSYILHLSYFKKILPYLY
ncbi:Uncharacterised protein [Klebsiella pneumoniae subsp. pneumoniae]|nr:Uncharacterised protein [Klebsiella pneumoniae subsp. pneumoniae]